MKKNWILASLFVLGSFVAQAQSVGFPSQPGQPQQPLAEKEWTFLLFLNGHNNLDSYGSMNINQMEQVGSNENLNMLVQWASLKNNTTKRLFIQKDNDLKQITSPVIQDMARVDMGDYKELVEFVRWGVQNYPAKKYMITVWNHGNGWQRIMMDGKTVEAKDISYDDLSGNRITTEQLGIAMKESAAIIGHKVDIYGSDACLMAMAEVAAEMKESVDYMVGSEEVEPGEGWPYANWMARWQSNAQATPLEVSTYLTEEYVKAYDGGVYGNQEVTFSAMDLNKLDGLYKSVNALNLSLAGLSAADLNLAKNAARATQDYYSTDYKDLGDFIDQLRLKRVSVNDVVVSDVELAIKDLVVALGSTDDYLRSHGVSVWLPVVKSTFNKHQARYTNLEFNKQTNWVQFLGMINK